ncbi:MAG: DUF2254 family protein, partial [Bryobacteraceae bacterium]
MILLIYFIHHISTSIQASKIVQVIAENMAGAIPKPYPSETGEPFEDRGESARRKERGQMSVTISTSGYLQTVDLEGLMANATEQDLMIELIVKPGDHLVKGDQVLRIWGAKELAEKLLKRIVAGFLLGGERTPTQDIRY